MTTSAILVIKLGALGDFVLALGPFKAIRAHHPDARIVLLTTPPFAELARACGDFDDVWLDSRAPPWRIDGWLPLILRLRRANFARVYDLQTNQRTSAYFRLLGGPRGPEWSGIAPGCSHPHANPRRDAMHTADKQAEQLRAAGIEDVPPPDLSWADADVDRFGLAERFALVVPGSAAHRPEKRWPTDSYAAFAAWLAGRGVQPVLLGTAAEARALAAVAERCPDAVDLGGRTGFLDIVALARRAAAAVGNDTGPMHLIAAAGCPSVVVYSHASDPALTAPRGPSVTVLRRPSLAELAVDDVTASLCGLLSGRGSGDGPGPGTGR